MEGGAIGKGNGECRLVVVAAAGPQGKVQRRGVVETVGSGRPYIPYIPHTGAVCMLRRTIEPRQRAVQ